MPIMFPGHITHSQITIADAEPVSAGFFHIKDKEIVIQDGTSESLKLGPNKEQDKLLLEFAFKSMPMSFYLDF